MGLNALGIWLSRGERARKTLVASPMLNKEAQAQTLGPESVDSLTSPRVYTASRVNGSLTLVEVDAIEDAYVKRTWFAELDAKAAELVRGKPSNPIARRALEVAEFYLKERDVTRAAVVIRLVAETLHFEGSQEHTLAVAALKNLGTA